MKIEKLLEKVKAGDTDALKIIYERYSPMMRSICFSITKEDEDTINDLVQDAFVLTYYSLSKLKDNSKFKEWCAAITKNTALKHLEKNQNYKLSLFLLLWMKNWRLKEHCKQIPYCMRMIF